MNIVVSKDGVQIARGSLSVDTSTKPPTGSFTPDNGINEGFTVPAHVSHWSTEAGGATDWNFHVSELANGNFPLGPGGTPFTYNFTGHENDNGTNPSGHVTWPPSIEGGDPVTWQGEATAGDDEPYSRTQGAS